MTHSLVNIDKSVITIRQLDLLVGSVCVCVLGIHCYCTHACKSVNNLTVSVFMFICLVMAFGSCVAVVCLFVCLFVRLFVHSPEEVIYPTDLSIIIQTCIIIMCVGLIELSHSLSSWPCLLQNMWTPGNTKQNIHFQFQKLQLSNASKHLGLRHMYMYMQCSNINYYSFVTILNCFFYQLG